MTDNIKLPPFPEGMCLREDIEDYALEAVRLNAQAVPEGMVLVNRGALNIVINALRRDAEEGRQVRGEMVDLLSEAPASAAPQPAQRPLTDEKDALLRQALDALENHSGNYKLSKTECVRHDSIVEAIRNRLGVKND
jgi:hypothetical protein